MSDTVIETSGLRRSFGCHPALDGLNLGVPSVPMAAKPASSMSPSPGPAPASNSAAAWVSTPNTSSSTPT